MTRATRSQTVHNPPPKQLDGQPPPPVKKSKQSKKRKRLSDVSDLDAHPPAKLSKSRQSTEALSTLDEPLAVALLDILQQIDTHGLLDRVAPDSAHASSSKSQSYSFNHSLRTLLSEPDSRDVRAVKLAIENLYPVGTSTRSQPTKVAQEQIQFCNLALLLLEQALQQSSSRISQTNESFALDTESDGAGDESIKNDPPARRRYALVQHLPGGDVWTSLDRATDSDTSLLKDISSAQAEKVSIYPSMPFTNSSRPTLGSYVASKRNLPKSKALHLTPRTITKGSFLDYGLNCSFAPSWDSEGAEMGRETLGALASYLDGKKLARRLSVPSEQPTQSPEKIEVPSSPLTEESSDEPEASEIPEDSLGGLNPQFDQVNEIVEAETEVSGILHQNANAIRRLKYLQQLRIQQSSQMTELEESTADALAESLVLSLSTRPRSTVQRWEDASPLLPATSKVKALRDILPWGSRTHGWAGTHPDGRTAALQDDLTVQVKATTVTQPAATSSTAPATTASSPAPATPYRSAYPYYPLNGVNGQGNYYPNSYPTPTSYSYSGNWGYPYQASPAGQKTGANGVASYSSYWASAASTPQKAIGNTAKPMGSLANGWHASPLPSHMALKRGDGSPVTAIGDAKGSSG